MNRQSPYQQCDDDSEDFEMRLQDESGNFPLSFTKGLPVDPPRSPDRTRNCKISGEKGFDHITYSM